MEGCRIKHILFKYIFQYVWWFSSQTKGKDWGKYTILATQKYKISFSNSTNADSVDTRRQAYNRNDSRVV
jgi:hypothetical protein